MTQPNKYNLYCKSNYKSNTHEQPYSRQKNFVNGLQNARKLLEGLEHSLTKSGRYEARLLRCRATHAHAHDWADPPCESRAAYLESTNSRSVVDLGGSWSTMSIVCMQYQYEELSKRYETLLQEYHGRCRSVSDRDDALAQLNEHITEAHAQLAHAHKTLISIGQKYLKLWHRKRAEKRKYEGRIKHLKATVRGMMAMCEQARLELDTRITHFMEREQNAPSAQLLAEIRKCNLLYLENLRLKTQIENIVPGSVFPEKP